MSGAGNVIPFRRPSQISPVIPGLIKPDPTGDPEEYRRDWRVLCLHAEEAKAEREYIEAHWRRLHFTDSSDATDRYFDREPAFRLMQALVDAVVRLPIPIERKVSFSRMHIRRKRQIVGQLWLKADGVLFDEWRAAIAADEAAIPKERR